MNVGSREKHAHVSWNSVEGDFVILGPKPSRSASMLLHSLHSTERKSCWCSFAPFMALPLTGFWHAAFPCDLLDVRLQTRGLFRKLEEKKTAERIISRCPLTSLEDFPDTAQMCTLKTFSKSSLTLNMTFFSFHPLVSAAGHPHFHHSSRRLFLLPRLQTE